MNRAFNLVKGGSSGGASASIYVTGLSQTDFVTMATPGGKTVAGVWDELPNPIAHGLPEGYTELEYIESTGSQYINTGLRGGNYRIVIKDWTLTQWASNSDNGVIGYNGPGTNGFILVQGRKDTNQMWAYLGNGSGISFYPITLNSPMQIEIIAFSNRQLININGVTYVNKSNAVNYLDLPIYLFAIGESSGNAQRYGLARGSEVWIYSESGTLLRDFIPCKRDADGKVSFFDFVTNSFIEPNGTFIAGPEIPATIPCFRLLANEYGLHTITATNGVKTSTEEVLVDALMDYWVELILARTYLYKYGREYEEITGGWYQNANGGNTLAKNIDHLYLYSQSTGKYGYFVTNNTINMTDYSTIHVLAECVRSNNTDLNLRATTSKTAQGTYIAEIINTNISGIKEVSFSVTSLNGKMPVLFQGISGSGGIGEYRVYAIWLE